MPPPRIATRRGAGTAAVCQLRPRWPTSRVSRRTRADAVSRLTEQFRRPRREPTARIRREHGGPAMTVSVVVARNVVRSSATYRGAHGAFCRRRAPTISASPHLRERLREHVHMAVEPRVPVGRRTEVDRAAHGPVDERPRHPAGLRQAGEVGDHSRAGLPKRRERVTNRVHGVRQARGLAARAGSPARARSGCPRHATRRAGGDSRR